MKVEFIKVTRIDGKVLYYTNVDGRIVDGSLELEEQKAYDKFNLIKQTGGKELIEVIETYETKWAEKN
jgi:hypothetical protein